MKVCTKAEYKGYTMFDKITEINLLYDFYSQLLTEKQQEVIKLYHGENFSLSEIGDEFSISRQGVYDSLKNAEKALFEYEAKLGLLKKFTHTSSIVDSANEKIDELLSLYKENDETTNRLNNLKQIVNELNK
jgi:predicted DNA-binding protein YlxM (UPF0122 family)